MKPSARTRRSADLRFAAFIVSIAACVASISAARVSAQDTADSAERRAQQLAAIRVELGSDDAHRIALALHEAVESDRREIVADLPDLLRRLVPMHRKWTAKPSDRGAAEAWNTAVEIAYDAAIRFDAKLSDAELDFEPLRLILFEDALLVVATRNRAACTKTLFALAGGLPKSAVERAACEVLAATAPDRLLDHLIRRLEIVVEVVVHDGDAPRPVPDGVVHGVGCGSCIPDPTLPPFPRYWIGFERGDEKFFDGPRALWFDRREVVGSNFGCHYSGRTLDDNLYLLDLLARLAGSGPWDLGLVATERLVVRVPVRWRDAESCEAQARTGIDAAVANWNAWMVRTRKAGHLPAPPELQPPSPLVLHVVDQRRDTSVALPALALVKPR